MIYKPKLLQVLIFMKICQLATVNDENDSLKNENNSMPYIALLSSRLGESIGIVIHAKWTVTSARSLVDKDGNKLHDKEIEIGVAFSEIYYDKWKDLMKYYSRKVVVHEDYQSNSSKLSNIGLIQSNQPLLNIHVKTINIRGRPWVIGENYNCFEVEWKKTVKPPNRYRYSIAKWSAAADLGKDACPCIQRSDNIQNYICISGKTGCTICTATIAAAVICEDELVGISHHIIDCRHCEAGQSVLTCPQLHAYRMYTYLCPYRRWISEYVTEPDDLKYDIVCSYKSKTLQENKSPKANNPMSYLLIIFLTVTYYDLYHHNKVLEN